MFTALVQVPRERRCNKQKHPEKSRGEEVSKEELYGGFRVSGAEIRGFGRGARGWREAEENQEQNPSIFARKYSGKIARVLRLRRTGFAPMAESYKSQR